MSECTNGELRDLLPEFVNGRLDAETKRAVEAHVAECKVCAAELALLRALKPALARAPVIDAQRIAAAVHAKTSGLGDRGYAGITRSARITRSTRLAIAAAALIAASALGYAFLARAHIAPDVASVHLPTRVSHDTGGAQRAVAPSPAPAPLVAPKHAIPVQPEQRVAVAPPHAAAPAATPATVAASDGVLDNLSDLSDDDLRTLAVSLDGISSVPDADAGPEIDPLGASLDDQSSGGS